MLPKLTTPSYNMVLPSSKKTILYRPLLVKEEKILLTAKESKDRKDIFNSLKQIISNCILTEDFNVDQITIFDMEYIFIKIRSKSIDNIVKVSIKDSDDGLEYSFDVNLDDIEVQFPENHTNKIRIENTNLTIIMKYPTPKVAEKLTSLKSVSDITFEAISLCIDQIVSDDNIYVWEDSTKKEKEDFLDSLPIETFEQIQTFFETMPKIEYKITYKNSQDKDKTVIFKDLEDFFTLG
jgi:hypothetical protein